ncbi:MAG: DUF4406 domain-containing protein [Spirochaetaceae bacterium]|jgi:hypothetical protein|nr:DUF4406 domain-containing protein [Spirochaetaceae bacterium]
MKKVMISQPMKGLTDEQIKKVRVEAIEKLQADGYEVVDNFFTDVPEVKNIPLYHLAKSILMLADCDALYMCEGWTKARGCLIEYECAVKYGIKVFIPEHDKTRQQDKE